MLLKVIFSVTSEYSVRYILNAKLPKVSNARGDPTLIVAILVSYSIRFIYLTLDFWFCAKKKEAK